MPEVKRNDEQVKKGRPRKRNIITIYGCMDDADRPPEKPSIEEKILASVCQSESSPSSMSLKQISISGSQGILQK